MNPKDKLGKPEHLILAARIEQEIAARRVTEDMREEDVAAHVTAAKLFGDKVITANMVNYNKRNYAHLYPHYAEFKPLKTTLRVIEAEEAEIAAMEAKAAKDRLRADKRRRDDEERISRQDGAIERKKEAVAKKRSTRELAEAKSKKKKAGKSVLQQAGKINVQQAVAPVQSEHTTTPVQSELGLPDTANTEPVKTTKTDIKRLNAEIKFLKLSNDKLKGEIDDLRKQFGDLQTSVTADIASHKATVYSDYNKLVDTVEEAKKRITAINDTKPGEDSLGTPGTYLKFAGQQGLT